MKFRSKSNGQVVKSTTGVEYEVIDKLGQGGVAKAFRVKRLKDKSIFVLKVYDPSQRPELARTYRKIHKNILSLMQTPVQDAQSKQRCKQFIGPLDSDSLVELGNGKFGYIMELVDTKLFLSVPKFKRINDERLFCIACGNIARLFRNVHLAGWCYKDINEGNIYINRNTGDVRIIDCDNISTQKDKTILGTHGYMAPEIYDTETPDILSDYFSMAVLFYRIFIGGWPMEGKWTQEYLLKNNTDLTDVANIVYGKRALFVFDPKDKSNAITKLVDPVQPDMYKAQVILWNQLPEKMRKMFIKTFSTGLSFSTRHLRTIDLDWIKTFEEVEKETIACNKCKKNGFSEHKKSKFDLSSSSHICRCCDTKLPKLPPIAPMPPSTTKTPPQTPIPKREVKELTTVTFSIIRDFDMTPRLESMKRQQRLKGGVVHPGIPEISKDGWLEILYHTGKKILGAKNNSSLTWTVVYPSGRKDQCVPGSLIELSKGVVIAVIPRKLQLTVVDIK